jgi:PAS domain S-box-containing protein
MTSYSSVPARIQIVGDDIKDLAYLRALLVGQGYEVRTASSGAQALESVHDRLPDLVLLGTSLPDMDGYQLCEQLKADGRTREVPVILVGASARVLDGAKACTVGGVDYVGKPLQEKEVLARVETHLALRLARRSLEEANAQLQELAHNLGERVKELSCLYAISGLVDTPGISLDEILEGAAAVIRQGWQYPEVTCVRIVLNDREYSTPNYRESPWQQSAAVMVDGEQAGTVQVGYLQPRPESRGDPEGEGPFLVEERNLLDAIAERLGKITERKRAEEAVTHREAELRATLYSIGDAVISTDIHGRVAHMNPVAERLTGWTEADAAGKPLEDAFRIVDEETRRPVDHPVARVLREGRVADLARQTLLVSKDGREIPIADSGAPIFEPQGTMTGVVLVFRDQTEERLTRRFTDTRLDLIRYAANHTLAELLTWALDEVGAFVDSPIGFYHFVEPDQKTLSLQQWSTRTLLEFCQAEGRGMHYGIDQAGVWVDCVYVKRPVIHNDYASLPHKKGMPEGHAEIVRELVVPVIREDKVVAILGVGNKPAEYTQKDVEIVSYLADVTWEIVRQKRAEEALRESEEGFRLAFENANIGVCLVDLEGRLTRVNSQMCEIFGYDQDELQGMTVNDIAHPEDRDISPTFIRQAASGQTVHTRFEKRYFHKQGHIVWGQVSSSLVRDAQGAPQYFISHVQDITERKRAEEALRQAKEAADEMRLAAEAANRAKSVFLTNMSHELRTPLNAVLGFSELMQRDASLTSEQQDNLAIIGRSGQHLLALINDVLELSKIESGRTELQPESFDLHQMLQELVEVIHLRAVRKGLRLDFERAPEVPRFVRTDQGKLRQVLINLLGNAIKFTQRGSVGLRISTVDGVRVTAGGRAPAPQDPHTTLRFEVEDTGVGIAPHELDAVFDAFVQTESGKESQMGTGLGMPISRQYVRMMGGDLSVQSRVDEGTVFRFDVPLELAEAGDVAGAEPERRVVRLRPGQRPADGGAYCLLVVDDVASSRELLVKLLTDVGSPPDGFEIREAGDGQEAIEVWEAWRPHLIFMDLRMPVMDGREATRVIKATPQGQQTVIIALTASVFDEERDESLAIGCDDFIRKPFRTSAIFEALNKHLGVQYVYEEGGVADRPERARDNELRTEMAALPPELVAQLKAATKLCDMEMIDRLVGEIQGHNASLAAVLANLAHDFEYDQILVLVEGAGDDSQ